MADTNTAPVSDVKPTTTIDVVAQEVRKLDEVVDSISASVKEYNARKKALLNLIKDLTRDFNKLVKERDALEKKKGGKRKKGGAASDTETTGETSTRKNGFTRPVGLSDELCDFLQIDKGTQLSRPEVTKRINDYIVKNKLQKENDRRYICADDKLTALLTVNDDGDKKFNIADLTYFNLQTSLRKHFVSAKA